MFDLLVIGGGAAGVAAAEYALNKELRTQMIVEGTGKSGTQQWLGKQVGVEYLAGADVTQALYQRVANSHAIVQDRVLSVAPTTGGYAVTTQQHGVQQARALIVATGATPVPLLIPGAQNYVNHGVGYSVAAHAMLLKDRTVAIIGATPRALRGTLEACRVARQVYLIIPDPSLVDQQRAAHLRRVANLTVLFGYRPTAITGTSHVERLMVSDPDGEESALTVDAVFADLGLLPNSGTVRHLVATDPAGFVVVDAANATNVAGIFAAGDVTTTPGEHTLIAIGAGVRAAVSAYDYLLSV